ncbi:FG-GAP-like repeat-containing protein [Puia sp.]|uniref:FG-GAP-like repeat-containing protein n=1 Tax=Puia sp. TaxID=2045100 RepID=UPI002F3F7F92
MPNLYPGIKPLFGSGRPCVLLFTILFLPFLVFAQPVITGFSPQSGAVGSTVTITGSNFGALPAANIVFFGSAPATVTAASSTSLTVTVPAGSSYQPLTVTAGGLTASSAHPFITTFIDPGQFTPDAFSTIFTKPTGAGPQSIFTIDIDGDGKPDLVVANGDANTVDIFRNTSTLGTVSFTLAVDYALPSGYYPIAVTAGDLDGDGKPDLVVSNYQVPKLAIFRNTSTSGNISIGSPVYYALGNYTTGLTVADCNGDGKPEIVAASDVNDMVSFFINNSTTRTLAFSPKQDLHLPANTQPYDVIVSDLDGDGKPDLASVNAMANSVSVFRNTGAIGGPLSFDVNVDFSVGAGPMDLAVGDLDGDGKPDLAIVNNADASITILQNASTPGNIDLQRGTDVPTGTLNPGSPWALVMADFDGDGLPDIASLNQLDNTVSIHKNTSTPGSPSIAPNVDYPCGDVPWALATADFDGDGLPDLAIVDNTSANITLLRNKNSNEPTITSFTPSSGPAGTVVTITGNNLGGATAVSFGGVAATAFTVNSPTSITATVGNGGTGLVTAVTPSGPASLGTFTYGVPSPTITGFSPISGSPGTVITINGANFTGATTVTFGPTFAASFTFVSDNQITAVVGNGTTGAVTVKTGPGSGSLSGFTYVPPPVTISSFSPQSGSQGTQVVIKGHGFLTAQSVSFGGTAAASFTAYGDTSIIAIVGSGASGDISITGSGNTDSQAGFTYVNNTTPPSNLIDLTSFSPMSGTTGDTVYIYGSHLTTANSVSFGGTPAALFQALSDNEMFAVVGAGSTGFVRVANSTSADSVQLFTYTYDSTKLSNSSAFQLIKFTGLLSGSNNTQLQWQVKNDASISYYAIEKSNDSIVFNIVSTVKSVRSNGASHTYAYTDPDATTGASWYRLKMQDTTASYTYSTKIRLQPVIQHVHPNPVKYGFFYFDPPDANSPSQLKLVSMSGVIMQTMNIAAGIPQTTVNVPGMPPGAYRLTWTNGKQSASWTILIL